MSDHIFHSDFKKGAGEAGVRSGGNPIGTSTPDGITTRRPWRLVRWGLLGFLLCILAILIFSFFTVLYSAGQSEEILENAGTLRANVQRYAKLEIGNQPRLADALASEIEDRWQKMTLALPRPTPIDADTITFMGSWANLFPLWREIRHQGLAYRLDPGPKARDALVNRSEEFISSRRIISSYMEEIRYTRLILVAITAVTALLLGIGVATLKS